MLKDFDIRNDKVSDLRRHVRETHELILKAD